MRRLLLIAAALLAATLVPVARAAVPPPSVSIGEVSRNSIEFHFHHGPYLVFVEMEGPGNRIALTVVRGGATADYATKPHFEGRSISARFGRFGFLDMTFTPTPGKTRRCGSIVQSEGVFTGELEFTGEHHFIHLDVHRIRGERTTAGSCDSGRAARVAVGDEEASPAGEVRGATLLAHAGGGSRVDTLTAVAGYGPRGFEGVVAGFRWEHLQGVQVSRGAQIGVGPARFRWDLSARTASLRPPAPFTGTATLTRGPGGPPRLRGSLRVPILGGRPLRLTGPRFVAHLRRGSPFD